MNVRDTIRYVLYVQRIKNVELNELMRKVPGYFMYIHTREAKAHFSFEQNGIRF